MDFTTRKNKNFNRKFSTDLNQLKYLIEFQQKQILSKNFNRKNICRKYI
ncbi:hypothetical protein ACJIZ3_023000 [Penstemon smallii]|uniref:Ribosomal protein S18 n=1 Tax=Penstemon smallii TaxID=265156 RepID=A0ABD3TMX8_9LAMI